MAGETSTYTTNYSSSMRESISDMITNIAPTECIFTNSISKGKANAKYEQWQEDTQYKAFTRDAVKSALHVVLHR